MIICPFMPDAQAGYTCNKGCDLREPRDCTLNGMRECPAIEWTCDNCDLNKRSGCPVAYDPYNTDGDCLLDK